jgi:hypothetical protein
MSNKMRIADYNFTRLDAEAYFAFTIWINTNPNGGVFVWKDIRLEISKK